MKKIWEEPRVLVQEFTPNEYVAVCWGVSCSTGAANEVEQNWMLDRWESNYENGQTHRDDHCGTLTNQWVIDFNDDGRADRMVETGTDGLGNLNCTLYTDATYRTTSSLNGVTIGSYIYWTTTSGNRTWHHQGTVVGTDSSHPNRS